MITMIPKHSRKTVLVCDKIHEDGLLVFKNHSFNFTYKLEITPSELVSEVAFYKGLIVRSRTKLTKDVILAANYLKVIGRAGTGVDNIDTKTAEKRNIKVINTPSANAQAVAEHTVGLILSLLRNYGTAFSSMREGKWLKNQLEGRELHGKTVGIIGHGNIGKTVEMIVSAFGAKTFVFSRHTQTLSYEKVFSSSDIVTIHVPLTPETQGSVSARILSLMKPTAFLINTSRGKVVDEQALYNALLLKKIAGAALDVFSNEPLPADSPLRKLENVILTPHIGASTVESFRRASMTIVEKVVEALL